MIILQLELFSLLLTGFLANKAGILPSDKESFLSTLVLSIFLPASIIVSFQLDLDWSQVWTIGVVFLVSCGIQVLYSLCTRIFYRNESPDKKTNLDYGILVSNAGFMGMPVAEAAFGPLGLLYASIYLIPQRIVMWSAGLALYTKDDKTSPGKKWPPTRALLPLNWELLYSYLNKWELNSLLLLQQP